jgi:hypothetical protein
MTELRLLRSLPFLNLARGFARARARARACAVVGALAVPVAIVPLFAAGCSGSDKASGVGNAKLPSGTRSEAMEHESCDEKSNRVETLDSNNDGKSDIRRVYDKASGREVCRIVDLNHDGKSDMFEYFDGAGQPRRREYAYDDSGAVNVIEYFEGGKLVRREYDTTGQHRIDTWDFFDPAKPMNAKTGRAMPIRRERDTNGDGQVDQWWVWEGEKVTISYDKSGDGKPDPEETIVLNDPDAGAPPPPAYAPTSSGNDAGTDDSSAPRPSGSASPVAPIAPADAGSAGSVDAAKAGAR